MDRSNNLFQIFRIDGKKIYLFSMFISYVFSDVDVLILCVILQVFSETILVLTTIRGSPTSAPPTTTSS